MRRVVLVLTMVALAGCSAPTTGAPDAAPTAAAPTGAVGSAPTTTDAPTVVLPTPLLEPKVDLPPRPREIRLDGLDPCAALTPAQRDLLEIDRPPLPFPSDLYADAPSCSIGDSVRFYGTFIAYATHAGGIELFTRTDMLRVDLEPTTVSGLPAIVVRSPLLPERCELIVDVADGQFLSVGASGSGDPDPEPVPQELLCAHARDVTEQVLLTLES